MRRAIRAKKVIGTDVPSLRAMVWVIATALMSTIKLSATGRSTRSGMLSGGWQGRRNGPAPHYLSW